MSPVDYHKGREDWHRERADAHSEPMTHLHYLHTDAANKHGVAKKLYQSGDPKAESAGKEARVASDKTVAALEHVGKGTPDKSSWTIYSHAYDVGKKDMGKSATDPIAYHEKKMVYRQTQMQASKGDNANLHAEAMGLHLRAKGKHIRGDSQAAEFSKKADAASKLASDSELGKSSSLTKQGKLKSAALHELHHPRTATQTREALDHLKNHKDTHTPGEQQAIAERVRRAAKKHGISMGEAKSPKAAKQNLERKARMAQKSLDSIIDLQKALSHAVIGGGQSPSTNPTGGIRRALPEGQDADKGYALGAAPPTVGGTTMYVRPQDRPAMSQKKKEKKIDFSTAPQFEGKPQMAEKSVEDEGEVKKAMTARSMPRMPRALMNDTYRSATAVLTREHSSIAKDIHTGPLTSEVIKELQEEEYNRTRRMPMYKSCDGCGRTYMAKSMDDECPTCSVNKSHYCSKCHQHLVKSNGGRKLCPLCG